MMPFVATRSISVRASLRGNAIAMLSLETN
jgi:hypothetical protein